MPPFSFLRRKHLRSLPYYLPLSFLKNLFNNIRIYLKKMALFRSCLDKFSLPQISQLRDGFPVLSNFVRLVFRLERG